MTSPRCIRRSALVVLATLVAGLVSGPAPAGAGTFPGANGRIAVADFVTGQIWGLNPDGTGVVQLTHTPKGRGANFPSWSPDSTHLLFTVFALDVPDDHARIWIADADGGNAHRLANDRPGYRDYAASYTPNGSHIVFARCLPDNGVCAIWKMRADGSEKHALTPFVEPPNETIDFFPTVSAHGDVAFTRFGADGIQAQVWVKRAGGGGAHPVTPPRYVGGLPNWSPDGYRLTFTTRLITLGSRIYTIDPDGTAIRRLTSTDYPNNDFYSAYSPEGDRIAFASDRRYDDFCCVDLFMMDANGAGEHLVDTGLTGVYQIAWGSAPLVAAGAVATAPSRTPATGSARAARRALVPDAVRRMLTHYSRAAAR